MPIMLLPLGIGMVMGAFAIWSIRDPRGYLKWLHDLMWGEEMGRLYGAKRLTSEYEPGPIRLFVVRLFGVVGLIGASVCLLMAAYLLMS